MIHEFTHLSDFLNGRGEDVEDDHPLLRRRPVGHFDQDHIGVKHQEAQVEELKGNTTVRLELNAMPMFQSSQPRFNQSYTDIVNSFI